MKSKYTKEEKSYMDMGYDINIAENINQMFVNGLINREEARKAISGIALFKNILKLDKIVKEDKTIYPDNTEVSHRQIF